MLKLTSFCNRTFDSLWQLNISYIDCINQEKLRWFLICVSNPSTAISYLWVICMASHVHQKIYCIREPIPNFSIDIVCIFLVIKDIKCNNIWFTYHIMTLLVEKLWFIEIAIHGSNRNGISIKKSRSIDTYYSPNIYF